MSAGDPPQGTLFGPSDRHMQVWTDYGPVGKGTTNPHYVLGENGGEYLIKGPDLLPDHPFAAANELIAVQLAELIGLPVLDYRVAELNGRPYFASSWMLQPTFYPAISADIFHRAENAERAYDIVAFDGLIANGDRHNENLVARRISDRTTGTERVFLLLNDHSHALVQPNASPRELAGRLGMPANSFVVLDFLREAITSRGALDDAIGRIESLSLSAIRHVVESVPEALLRANDHNYYADFSAVEMVERELQPLVSSGRVTRGHSFPRSTSGIPRAVDFFANSGANVAADVVKLALKRADEIRRRSDAEALKVWDIRTSNEGLRFMVFCDFSSEPELAEPNENARQVLATVGAEVVTDMGVLTRVFDQAIPADVS